MLHTDGKPTICSSGTKIKERGITNYPSKNTMDRTKVIKDTDEEFEFEKTKMFLENLPKQPSVKREQLAKAFKKILSDFMLNTAKTHFVNLDEHCLLIDIDRLANKLLYEVSTRVYIGGK